jgi:hypothetical protein
VPASPPPSPDEDGDPAPTGSLFMLPPLLMLMLGVVVGVALGIAVGVVVGTVAS